MLDDRFQFLDELPDALYQTVVTTRHGRLDQRVSGILQWRRALLAGALPNPDELRWPEADVSRRILPRLETLELADLCAGEKALTDQVIEYLCVAVDSVDDWAEHGGDEAFDDPLARHRHRGQAAAGDYAGGDAGSGETSGEEGEDAGQALLTVPEQAAPSALGAQGATLDGTSGMSDDMLAAGAAPGEASRVAGVAAGVAAGGQGGDVQPMSGAESYDAESNPDIREPEWEQLAANWRETRQVVSGMGTKLGRGWDLSQGTLKSGGWRQFVELRRWIKGRPELIAVVNSLGRGRDTAAFVAGSGSDPALNDDAEPVPLSRPQPVPRLPDAGRGNPVPCPTDTRGVTRSDEIARMLPQELACLGHPLLKSLWHAHRAEQALLTYRVEGVLSQHRVEPDDLTEPPPPDAEPERDEHGPLILCIDSSASMHGEPETLAKAIALEVVRLANQEQRDCLLFTFSGPGQLLETELRFTPAGLRRIIRFLQQRFDGGTDIATPIGRALDRIAGEPWSRADILVISDGRFPLPDGLLRRVQDRRLRGLRVRGIATGGWSASGLEQLCDSVHRVAAQRAE